ncbi:hypothetical protein GBF35_25195 [Nonomuraea phyllanthi]|uniref:hypothetical protein n=1 Tax=Nonomuraea phyllanthi TaxID=2219224 RepID=UPI00129357FC|nr:hypothetical protein [Nonomuraea phyllanthi]QFY09504.1 hypothetical protein GBF35_25195 [Nonomuraea phyllanthi]
MRHQHSLRDLLHRATHHVPGVPAHTERPAGHQGQAGHGHGRRHSLTHHRSHHRPHHHGFNHSPARPPRVLAAWQTRIARLFGQELG